MRASARRRRTRGRRPRRHRARRHPTERTPFSEGQRCVRHPSQLKPLFPGIDIPSHATGRATIDFWTAYPWTKGSYSYWKVGQYQAFAGAERERSNNCHFAGEHTSIDFQGYLNGAVQSGEMAADEVLADLK